MSILVFATHNPKKILELRSLLKDDLTVLSASELAIPEPEETGQTMEENSALKANFVFDYCKQASLADDSGLEVDALDGRPGVFSARYAGEPRNDLANMHKVLMELGEETRRNAQFRTVLTYRDEHGMHQFEGVVRGTLLHQPRGEMGFGYDPIFVPDGESRTFAEMELNEKNLYSHRARAFNKFLTFIQSK